MKTNILLGKLCLIFLILFVASCNKEDQLSLNQPSETSENLNKEKKPTKKTRYNLKSNMPQLYVDENGVLVFDDLVEFQSYFDWVETETESYINTYLSNYSDLAGDELADSLHAAGFDSEEPLKLFEENFLGYNSLRKKIEMEMQPFLEQEDFDITETPEAHFINNPYYRTILNEDCAYKIGDTTYIILEEGVIAMGPQASYNQMVTDISSGDSITELRGPYVRIVISILTGGGGGSTCTGCRTNRLKMVEKKSGNKMQVLSLGVIFSGASTTITARVLSYGRLFSWSSWESWPYSKNVSFNTVNVYTGSSCWSYGSMQGESQSGSILCLATRTDWGTAARRVKCNTLSATGNASSLSNSTVTIGW